MSVACSLFHSAIAGRRALAVACATLLLVIQSLPVCAANIEQASELATPIAEKMQSVLVVGTSAAHPDKALGNKQALVAAEMRKLMKAAGLQIFAIGIKPDEANPTGIISEAIAKNGPSHVMSVTVPNGTVQVRRSTGETVAATAYVVKTEITDAKTGQHVWTGTTQVDASFFLGAANADVAAAIVARMRSDGLF